MSLLDELNLNLPAIINEKYKTTDSIKLYENGKVYLDHKKYFFFY